MMLQATNSGRDRGHSGRSSGALGVDWGVESGSEGAGGSPVAATNTALIRATLRLFILGIGLVFGACGQSSTDSQADTSTQPGVTEGCGSVRLTEYGASSTGWCEFDRGSAVLPSFVRDGLTLAIAEPYDGSSHGGEPGESCGECWEVSTIHETRIVMVHDLCPIQGNPLCGGGHFHFDLSSEAADALRGGALDEASTRRVPCPVEGNIHAQINDRNEWGYVRLQFVNHRIPIRKAEYRGASGEWRPMPRSGGAWHVVDDSETFSSNGPGGFFRLTSAQGEIVEGTASLGYEVAIGALFDLGAQLSDLQPPEGEACEFVPPAEVYDDAFGGIPEVRWAINPWGDATASETDEDCYQGSCLRISPLPQWAGFHLYYRQAFPTSTFATVSMRLRAESSGHLTIAPSHDGVRCEQTTATVGPAWSELTIDLASICGNLADLNGLTIDNPGATMDLYLDAVRFIR
jgi:expansin (peptidoglycan-binding protein)